MKNDIGINVGDFRNDGPFREIIVAKIAAWNRVLAFYDKAMALEVGHNVWEEPPSVNAVDPVAQLPGTPTPRDETSSSVSSDFLASPPAPEGEKP